jgi:hypothetical protein
VLTRRPALRSIAIWLLAAVSLGLPAPPGASAQTPAFVPPVVIDGPAAGMQSLDGVVVARDGTGGLVYVKSVEGVNHVFVSRLTGGSFGPPEQVDAGLPGPSSQPVIAAWDGGVLLVAFIEGGDLYVTGTQGGGIPFSPPQDLWQGASSPALALSIHGKGYLAFTSGSAASHDVRAAYWVGGSWSIVPGVLDAAPGDDAGDGTGRPAVAAAGDGVGIVAWGEAGHVYTRRVWAAAPSVAFEQADLPAIGGSSEVSADLPTVGTGDDSSYADVALHEVVTDGRTNQSRVLARRLRASTYDLTIAADGLTSPDGEGAVQPRLAVSPAGHGFITSARDSSDELFATLLGGSGTQTGFVRVDALANPGLPYAVPATTGLYSGLVAWQEQPVGAPAPEIAARFFDGTAFGPETVASDPSLGPTVAAQGLAADGDSTGDIALAWVQGTGSSATIVAGQLFYPPGGFGPLAAPPYTRAPRPLLSWSAAREQWGPLAYSVTIDGVAAGQTTATSLLAPPLADGRHTWQVTATNRAGLTSVARPASVWVDTSAPTAQFTLTGARRAGSPLRLHIRDSDAPPPEPSSAASGIASVLVIWGDGARTPIIHGAVHVYRRPGHYTLRVTVADRAGNATTLAQRLVIRRRPAARKR